MMNKSRIIEPEPHWNDVDWVCYRRLGRDEGVEQGLGRPDLLHRVGLRTMNASRVCDHEARDCLFRFHVGIERGDSFLSNLHRYAFLPNRWSRLIRTIGIPNGEHSTVDSGSNSLFDKHCKDCATRSKRQGHARGRRPRSPRL